MNADYAFLLNTVLSERGCADTSLQRTAQTVPLAYRTLAEQSYYILYVVSVVKALLHEEDGAFAQLARAQADRHVVPAAAGNTRVGSASGSGTAPRGAASVALPVPPLTPSDSLDVQFTIIGGGTCCELLLRLLCGRGRGGAAGGVAAASAVGARQPLVHPSHITVVTRQLDQLAAYAGLGVHCLTRHQGLHAVASSDVVVLACPPAQLGDVTRDLYAAATTDSTTAAAASKATSAAASLFSTGGSAGSAPLGGASAAAASAGVRLLRANAVLLSCLAGVPVRKVANAFHHEPLSLTFAPTLLTCRLPATNAAATAAEREAEMMSFTGTSSFARASTCVPSTTQMPSRLHLLMNDAPPFDAADDAHGAADGTLEEAGWRFARAAAAYRRSRVMEMLCSTSFLRPAVLQQASAASATEAAAAKKNDTPAWQHYQPQYLRRVHADVSAGGGGTAFPSAAAPPRLADFTAGRHPSTCPTLEEYMQLWRVLQAYVRATFDEEATGQTRGGTGAGPVGAASYGGLVRIVVPASAGEHRSRRPRAGAVEAELLPALALLPADKTLPLWDAWWGNSGFARGRSCSRSRSRSRSVVISSTAHGGRAPMVAAAAVTEVPAAVTDTTGLWIRRVYKSVAALKADLDAQYSTVVGARAR